MYKLFAIISACLAVAAAVSTPEDVQAVILKSDSQINPDGSYIYAYETSNSIKADESGVGGINAAGSYAYTAPDGQPIQLEYTADENGYQPKGDHLPTPPPIPDYILRSLAYIEAHPFDVVKLQK